MSNTQYKLDDVRQALQRNLDVLLKDRFSSCLLKEPKEFLPLIEEIFRDNNVYGPLVSEKQLKTLLEDIRLDARISAGQGKITKTALCAALEKVILEDRHLFLVEKIDIPVTKLDGVDMALPDRPDGFTSKTLVARKFGISPDGKKFKVTFDDLVEAAQKQGFGDDGVAHFEYKGIPVVIGCFNIQGMQSWCIKDECLDALKPLFALNQRDQKPFDTVRADFEAVWKNIEERAVQEGLLDGWVDLAGFKGRPINTLNNIGAEAFQKKMEAARGRLQDNETNRALFDKLVALHTQYREIKEQDRSPA